MIHQHLLFMGKFTGSVTKARGKLVIEIPAELARAFPKGAKVLVDFKMVDPIAEKPRDIKQRNRMILQKHREGFSAEEIAICFGIKDRSRVKAILEETQDLENIGSIGLYLSTTTINVIYKATGLCEPDLETFRKYLRATTNWREIIMKSPRGGKKTIEEIKAFCQEHNIEV